MKATFSIIFLIATILIVLGLAISIRRDFTRQRAEIKKSLTTTASELTGTNVAKFFTNIVYLCKDQNEKSAFRRSLNDKQLKSLEEAKRQLLNAQLFLLLLFDDQLKAEGVDARKTGAELIEFGEGLSDQDPYLWMSFFAPTPDYTPRVETFIEDARTRILRTIEEF